MATIRSLLWIGSGRGLATSGVAEAPELDVTWVPDLVEAESLPRVPFDGVLLDLSSQRAGVDPSADEETLGAALARASACAPGAPVFVALADDFPGAEPNREARASRETAPPSLARSSDFERVPAMPQAKASLDDQRVEAFLRAGAAAVLALDGEARGAGFVDAVSRALDASAVRATASGGMGALLRMGDPGALSETSAGGIHDDEDSGAPRFVARSPAMREVFELVALAATSPSTVLLCGETGVGKEVVARALHARSGRSNAPFVAINCAAFPETLLESELFGHAKGAFTGADRAKTGLFEAAGTGTLFLDEIAEMALPLQAKLLRVLQEREIRPIGATRAVSIACRIIAATNRDLPEEVRRGQFREDLFYRLNVFPIRIPPLRERRSDILPLARHFLALHGPREGKTGCHLSLATSQLIESYGWPGNVRELENEMLRVLMLTPSSSLVTPKALSRKLVEILEPIGEGASADETLRDAVERVEAWLIRRALANNGGRKASTARRLGLTREGLYKKLKRLGID